MVEGGGVDGGEGTREDKPKANRHIFFLDFQGQSDDTLTYIHSLPQRKVCIYQPKGRRSPPPRSSRIQNSPALKPPATVTKLLSPPSRDHNDDNKTGTVRAAACQGERKFAHGRPLPSFYPLSPSPPRLAARPQSNLRPAKFCRAAPRESPAGISAGRPRRVGGGSLPVRPARQRGQRV